MLLALLVSLSGLIVGTIGVAAGGTSPWLLILPAVVAIVAGFKLRD
ncbi:hypothetical protein [Microlunatus elymi]|nr:hypothetical protein [Microlunatus elymi]